MRQRLRRYAPKFTALAFLAFTVAIAQDLTNYLTPSVARVGAHLACRCGGCKESVGQCPMLRCDSADPMRRRIYDMQSRGLNDKEIIGTIVREQGAIALYGQQPLAWIAWAMPPIALLAGFGLYSFYVRRNRAQPAPLQAEDRALIERYRAQMLESDIDGPDSGEHSK